MTMLRDRFEEREQDFAWCERVIKRNSPSFYRAFSQLPDEKRRSVYAIYAFCRLADDSVDREANRAMLDGLQDELEQFLAGCTPDKPLWRALDVVFGRFDMEARPFFDMVEGQRRDLDFHQPRTMEELEEYSYYVAGSVGLMLLPLLHTSSRADESLRASGIALGVAMQLTNILRDVGEDLDTGRVYVPASVLEAVGCSRAHVRARRADEAFIAAWEAVAHRAEELYQPMQHSISALDEDSRLAVLSSLFLYRGILDQVRREGYGCFTHRAVVPAERAIALVAEAQAALQEGRG